MLFKKTEKHYLDNIDFIIKDCWEMSMDQKEAIESIRRYLKNKKLNKDEHPFLIYFKESIDKLPLDNSKSKEDTQEVLKIFYTYYRNINKIK